MDRKAVEMKATVVNVRDSHFDVYIGRRCRGYEGSKWANPFKIGRQGTRAEVIAKYEKYVRGRSDLMAALPELEGKRLGCWCSPKPCHGDILVKLIEERKRGA